MIGHLSNTMPENLTDPFVLAIYIHADLAQVRFAWTATELTKWFLDAATHLDPMDEPVEELVSEGTIEWRWRDGTEDRARVYRADAQGLEFGWYENRGRITVSWEQEGGEVRVGIRQEMIEGSPESRAHCQFECYAGWTFTLVNLKAWLEHGLDLRETTLGRKKIANL